MNWAIDNNGAYDYAADTRGYTPGAVVEYHDDDAHFAARFGEMLMPTVANGIDYDFDLLHARGENLEVEYHPEIGGRRGVIFASSAFSTTPAWGATPRRSPPSATGASPTPTLPPAAPRGGSSTVLA